jgi:hypothetical protein
MLPVNAPKCAHHNNHHDGLMNFMHRSEEVCMGEGVGGTSGNARQRMAGKGKGYQPRRLRPCCGFWLSGATPCTLPWPLSSPHNLPGLFNPIPTHAACRSTTSPHASTPRATPSPIPSCLARSPAAASAVSVPPLLGGCLAQLAAQFAPLCAACGYGCRAGPPSLAVLTTAGAPNPPPPPHTHTFPPPAFQPLQP